MGVGRLGLELGLGVFRKWKIIVILTFHSKCKFMSTISHNSLIFDLGSHTIVGCFIVTDLKERKSGMKKVIHSQFGI